MARSKSATAAMDSSPFLKRILVPFWTIRILIMLIELIIYGLVLVYLSAHSDDSTSITDKYTTTYPFSALIAIIAVIFTVIVLCLILDLISIVKRVRHTLTPRLFLVFNVVQTTVWTVLLVLSLIGARNGLSVAIAVVIYLSFLGLLIYASVVFHRHRKGALRSSVPLQEPYSTAAPAPYNSSGPPPPQQQYDAGYNYGGGAYAPPPPQQQQQQAGNGYSGGYGEGGQTTQLKGSTTYYAAPAPHSAV